MFGNLTSSTAWILDRSWKFVVSSILLETDSRITYLFVTHLTDRILYGYRDMQCEWTSDTSYGWFHDFIKTLAILLLLIIIAFVEFFLRGRRYTNCFVLVFSFNSHNKPVGRLSINWCAFGCNKQLEIRKCINKCRNYHLSSPIGLYSNVTFSVSPCLNYPHSPPNTSCSCFASFFTFYSLILYFCLVCCLLSHPTAKHRGWWNRNVCFVHTCNTTENN